MKKRILILSDSFKGSLSSLEVGCALKRGILKSSINSQVDVLSVSDGGEGFIDSLNQNKDFVIHDIEGKDLLLRKVKTQYGTLKNNVYLESAKTCGIELLKLKERDPLLSTSYGLGQSIKYLIKQGRTNFTIGLGGTATNDGGAGLIAGLGGQFFNNNGEEFIPTGGNLRDIIQFSLPVLDLSKIKFTLATDVTNTLLGKKGATYTFAEQKGGADLEYMEKGIEHYATFFQNKNIDNTGSGAAGGIGFSLMNIASCDVKSGADVLYNSLDIEASLSKYDLIISGEGKIDAQTNDGKWVDFIHKKCLKHHKKLLLFCGQSNKQDYQGVPIQSIMSLGIGIEKSERNGAELLEELAFKYFSLHE